LPRAEKLFSMKPKKEKLLIALICVLGVCTVAYGMANESNSIFLFGLLSIIAGYLLIRRKLKDSRQDKS
jgi:uncharacterized membrane protein HdeD (DUF308 family)